MQVICPQHCARAVHVPAASVQQVATVGFARHDRPMQHEATPPGQAVPAAMHIVTRQVPIVQVDPAQHAVMPAPQAMPAGVHAGARQRPAVQVSPAQQSAAVEQAAAAAWQAQRPRVQSI